MKRAVLLGLALLAAGLLILSGQRNASADAPPFALLLPDNASCPAGIEVALPAMPASPDTLRIAVYTDPGPIQTPTKNPGPIQCGEGFAVEMGPGQTQASGTAVSLPLTGESCAAGTGVLMDIAGALGLTVDPASGGSGPCPAGSAAMNAIDSFITEAQSNPGQPQCPAGSVGPVLNQVPPALVRFLSPGLLVQKNPGPQQCPPGTILFVNPGPPNLPSPEKNPGPIQLPAGFLRFYKQPGPQQAPGSLLLLFRSATPGVYVLKQPGPIQ